MADITAGVGNLSPGSKRNQRQQRAVKLYDLVWVAATHPKVELSLAELIMEIDCYASAFLQCYRKKCSIICNTLAQLSGIGVLTADMALTITSGIIIDGDVSGTGVIDGVARASSRLTTMLYGARGLAYIVK